MGLLENVKMLCTRKGITLSELEKRAGLPANVIYKWDSINPGIDKVTKVAKALGCMVDDLVK